MYQNRAVNKHEAADAVALVGARDTADQWKPASSRPRPTSSPAPRALNISNEELKIRVYDNVIAHLGPCVRHGKH